MFDRIFELKNEAKKILDEQFDLLNQSEEIIKNKDMHPLEKLGRMLKIERRERELKHKLDLLNEELHALGDLLKAVAMN